MKNRFPRKDEELENLLKEVERYAATMLKKNGAVPPSLMALTPTGFVMYVPDRIDGVEGKDKFANAARLIAIAHRASAVAIVLEALARFLKAEGTPLDLETPLSQAEDREEVVPIMAETRETKLQRIFLIQRNAAGKFSGFAPSPTREASEFSGRFAEIMPPKEASKENVEVAKLLFQTMGVKLTFGGFNPMWN